MGGGKQQVKERERLEDDLRLAKHDQAVAQQLGRPSEYETLLVEYVECKLQLHRMRKSMFYPHDAYCEREGDFSGVMARCDRLKEQIKEMRRGFNTRIWGGLQPEIKTEYDRPVLEAMEEHTCHFWTTEFDPEGTQCQRSGTHWFRGQPYCRTHFGQERRNVKMDRRIASQQARRRFMTAQEKASWGVVHDPKLPNVEVWVKK